MPILSENLPYRHKAKICNVQESQIMDLSQRIEIVVEIPPTRIEKNMGGLNPKNSEKAITIFANTKAIQ